MRDHEMRIPLEDFQKTSCLMKDACQSLMSASDLGGIRGIEGQAGAAYFSVFDAMILNQKDDFFFTERNRRPPLDRMNCLLSFLYAMLANDAGAALEGVGLDSYVGFLHRDRPGPWPWI